MHVVVTYLCTDVDDRSRPACYSSNFKHSSSVHNRGRGVYVKNSTLLARYRFEAFPFQVSSVQ